MTQTPVPSAQAARVKDKAPGEGLWLFPSIGQALPSFVTRESFRYQPLATQEEMPAHHASPGPGPGLAGPSLQVGFPPSPDSFAGWHAPHAPQPSSFSLMPPAAASGLQLQMYSPELGPSAMGSLPPREDPRMQAMLHAAWASRLTQGSAWSSANAPHPPASASSFADAGVVQAELAGPVQVETPAPGTGLAAGTSKAAAEYWAEVAAAVSPPRPQPLSAEIRHGATVAASSFHEKNLSVAREPPGRAKRLVRIRGLKSAEGSQLNGQLGRCDRLNDKTGRWGVILGDGTKKALKAENLFSFDEYLKVAHEGRTPVDIGPFMNDFLTNSKYDAPGKTAAGYKAEPGLSPQERLQQSYEKAQREGRKASPRLSKDEEKSGKYSPFVVKKVELQAGPIELGIIAPRSQDSRRPIPTILAISRGDQSHVAKLFRALRAEERGWQVLVPMRTANTPDFFEPAGQSILEQLMKAVLEDRESDISPFGAMSNVFHFLGISHGAAALLSLACKSPEQVGSLTLIQGFLPQLTEVQALRNMENIHFYVGDQDELGHREYLRGIKDSLKEAGGRLHTHIVKGASHYDIDKFIDLEDLWKRLELAR
ncbi:unnamed protein product [Symbiodinium pilosum]|uniref:Phospholipase/carboxylesterase/thioesterase domain-containing protein n=1 Tax=Symbiodinium pilosum TaxID=2952 RepID=A0A812VRV7_SYMPI|nr:unnamed protein product [Symbiodinium pilosum]